MDGATLALSAVEESAIASGTMGAIVAQCGTDAEGIDSLVSAMNSTILAVGDAVDAALSALSCEVVVPSFTSAAYDAACGVSVNSIYY